MEIKVNGFSNGEIIKIIREWTEENQKEFSKTLGVSKETIQSYETNRRVYNINFLRRLSKEHNLEIIIKKK